MRGLPEICLLGQVICSFVPGGQTYRPTWMESPESKPREFVCIRNITDKPAYFMGKPQSGRPPAIILGPGLEFCEPAAPVS